MTEPHQRVGQHTRAHMVRLARAHDDERLARFYEACCWDCMGDGCSSCGGTGWQDGEGVDMREGA